jgi:hypothetical protein
MMESYETGTAARRREDYSHRILFFAIAPLGREGKAESDGIECGVIVVCPCANAIKCVLPYRTIVQQLRLLKIIMITKFPPTDIYTKKVRILSTEYQSFSYHEPIYTSQAPNTIHRYHAQTNPTV